MWKVSPKTPHTQFLCRVQFYKLPLKTNREIHLLLSAISFIMTTTFATRQYGNIPNYNYKEKINGKTNRAYLRQK
jgi:hypothetical protein